MNIDTLKKVILELERKEISFVYRDTFMISGNDIPRFLENTDLFMANENGISVDDYIAWDRDNTSLNSLQCNAITRQHRRCKNAVRGGEGQIDMQTYAKLRGGYCSIHGG
jgi:hypothetical protein